MRVFLSALAVGCLVAGGFVAAQQPAGGDARGVLAAAREAMGGDQKLAAIKTFVATGRTRQVSGNNLVPIEFEIACELPDKYVRRDEVPARESEPTSSGFNADSLIQVPPMPAMPAGLAALAAAQGNPSGAKPPTVPPGNPAGQKPAAPEPQAGTKPSAPVFTSVRPPDGTTAAMPPPDPRRSRVNSLKQDFVRLTLGMFATSFSSYPLTFTLAGQAEAPQGKADVVDVKGPANFALRLFINSETHLPIMVSWTTAGPGGAKPVEYRLYYADYRDVGNGVKFPFRLRRAVAGATVEETNFDNFKLNARIDARKFEVVK